MSSSKPKAGADTFPCIYLANQSSGGPENSFGHHVSTFITDPVMAIERHSKVSHQPGFDIETAIEGYSSQTWWSELHRHFEAKKNEKYKDA